MQMDGYELENDKTYNKPVRLASNGRIMVTREDGEKEGYLVFVPGEERDGGVFRLIVGLLLIVDVLAVLLLTLLIIRGL